MELALDPTALWKDVETAKPLQPAQIVLEAITKMDRTFVKNVLLFQP